MRSGIDVLFVCHHGSAKSLIAAEHFQRLARARGLVVDVASAGLEPDDAIPAHVVAGLATDGITIVNQRPGGLTDLILASSCRIVAFNCSPKLPGLESDPVRWDDVPAVSDGYAAARDVIVAHLGPLVERMAGERARLAAPDAGATVR